jgi:phage tail sheath protein FI
MAATEEPVPAAPGSQPAEVSEEAPEEVLVTAGGGQEPPENGKKKPKRAASNGFNKGAYGMSQYLSPGVYVEEIPSALKPIAGVGTSTAGFIGVYTGTVQIPVPNPDYDPTKPTKPESSPGKGDASNLPYEITYFNPTDDELKKLDNAVTDAEANASDDALKTAADALKKAVDAEKAAADAVKLKPTDEAAIKELSVLVAKTREARELNAKARAAKAKLPRLRDLALEARMTRPGDDELKALEAAAANERDPDKAKALHDKAVHARMIQTQYGQAVPAGKARLCTSFRDFEKHFGTFSLNPGHNQLAHGVYGFFNNGGSRCFVIHFNTEADAMDFSEFEAIDEIAIVAAPGVMDDALQQAVVDHCENMGDRFAILDGKNIGEDDEAVEDNIKTVGYSDYAALYFPWIKVFDVPTKRTDPTGDGLLVVPPSGHMAGIYAHVDTTRGVHKAPANEVPRGVLGVSYAVSKAIQDGLNPHGVNCIRDMNGNTRVWGARTWGGDMNLDYKYINVRRLLLFLRESIDEGTQWVVFEPNDRTLWAKIVRNVTAFLTVVWRDGALFGSTPQEAFYVKCDDVTNPPEIRDLGRVITEIGVAPVKPAEFVIFRISQWAGPQGQ